MQRASGIPGMHEKEPRKKGIEGRSRMTKAQLERELSR
jgi:hypothetical protein